jgi:hypothetical protein
MLLSKFRGHGLAKHPTKPNLVLMFSRRPGNQGIVVNLDSNAIKHSFTSPDHLFMEGHGCFSHDGKYLFCTETNRHSKKGIITVRDTQSFHIIREIPSGGIGPHEIQTIPNQTTLAVANGGLIKDQYGKVINSQSMQSNLALIDYVTGTLLSAHQTKNPKASLRHLDVSEDGIIAVGMQIQDYDTNSVTALASLTRNDGTSTLLDTPIELLRALNGYIGSVRINNRQRTAAVTSPKGNLALFWCIDSGNFLGYHRFHNVCGLTISNNQEYFVLSNSAGKIRQINSSTLLENTDLRQQLPKFQWDNHMITASS